MHDDNQQELIELLRPTISSDRLATYLTASGFNHQRALQLYVWNSHLGEAFHPCIQATEVALRNRINQALISSFGNEWWRSEAFLRASDHHQTRDLALAQSRIERKGLEVTTPQMVATLSFGFWVGILSGRYNPTVWSSRLRSAFPYLPQDYTRKSVHQTAKRVADFRNRISHHEPIFKQNITEEYSNTIRLLSWTCPHKAEWVKSHIRTSAVMRERP